MKTTITIEHHPAYEIRFILKELLDKVELFGAEAEDKFSAPAWAATIQSVADTAAVSASAGAGSREGEGAPAEHLAVAVQEYISACGRMHRPDMDVTFNALGPALKAYREAEAHVAAATGEAAPVATGDEELHRLLDAWVDDCGEQTENHTLWRLLSAIVERLERNGR